MLSGFTLSQKGLFWLCIVLFVQFVFVFMLTFLYGTAQRQVEAGLHDQSVIGHLNKISNLWSKLGVELPRSLALPDFEESPISRASAEIDAQFNELQALIGKNLREKAEIDSLMVDTKAAVAAMIRAKDAWYDRDIKRFAAFQDEIVRLSDLATAKSNKLVDELSESQRHHKLAKDRLSSELNSVLLTGLFVNVGTTLLTAYLFIGGIVGNTERISHNTKRLAHGIPLNEPLSGDDEIAQLDRTFREMAEALAEAERKERALIDNARDVICTLDADGIFLSVNAAATSMLGRDPDHIVGKLFLDFVAAEERKKVNTLLQSLASTTSKTARIQTRLTGQDGVIVYVLLAVNWSASDRLLYCLLHDISERWQIERMKRQFVAMITHDLRSPLNSIMNTLDALEEGIYSPSSAKGGERIYESVQNIERMLQLLTDLLSLVNVDATSIAVELQNANLREIIQESIGSVRAYAEQGKISIETDLVDSVVVADKMRMVQVLVNLLANAIKFSRSGTSVIVRCIEDSAIVRIEVTDSGRGISQADQKLIFEPYRQAQSSRTSPQMEGTGLGLTICKSIIESHNGKIGVISAESKGSTFWIEIPRAQSRCD